MSRDDAWLLDMATACRSILEFRQGFDRDIPALIERLDRLAAGS